MEELLATKSQVCLTTGTQQGEEVLAPLQIKLKAKPV
jgi:hypothetical protein